MRQTFRMKITNLSEFTRELAKIENDDSKTLFFRGHNDKTYKLKPTLYRQEKYFKSEHKIFRDAILNCPQDFYTCKSTIEILVKMQHYGVPTRILDLTRNALTALYFACESNLKLDGEVIILNIPDEEICYYDSDKISILANLAKQDMGFEFNYDPDLNYEATQPVTYVNKKYFSYLLHSIKEEKPHFQDIINPRHLEEVFAVQVKLDNPRIIKQNGAFLIFGVDKEKSNSAQVKQNWIVNPSGERIIIPANSKKAISNELKILGINHSTLFPELEDQANYLKEKYRNNIA